MNAYIKSLMDEHGINQKELAEILGISPAAVSQWKACSGMSVETLFALSKLFQITVDELADERRADETPEQKWDRMYNPDGYVWSELVETDDKESMSLYLEKLNNLNSRFYKLLYKKMAGTISSADADDLSRIGSHFRPDPWRSDYFFDKRFDRPMKEITKWIAETLNEAVGFDNEGAFIWELQRIYRNDKMISPDEIGETEDDDLFYMWYSALTQEDKDSFLTDLYRKKEDNSVLYELIKRGGRIKYSDSDLPRINFNKTEAAEFDGEIRPLKNLDEIKKIFSETRGNLPYDRYQKIINRSAMGRIEAEYKYKKKNPIKYWEYYVGLRPSDGD